LVASSFSGPPLFKDLSGCFKEHQGNMPRTSTLCDVEDQRVSLPPPRRSLSGDEEVGQWQDDSIEKKARANVSTEKANLDEVSFASVQEPSTEQQQNAAESTKKPAAERVRGSDRQKAVGAPVSSCSFQACAVPDVAFVTDEGNTVNATVADEINVVHAELFREDDLVSKRADEIAKQVVLQLRDSDKANLNNNESDNPKTSNRQRLIRIIGGAVAAVVIAAVVVAIVLATRPKTSSPMASPKPTPAPAPTPMLTPAPTPAPTLKPAPVNPCKDFPCSSHFTVMELVNGASSHTLLAEYLNRPFNSYLMAYLSFNKTTLFAPTDQSFNDLKSPYSLYFQNNSNYWNNHLYVLLENHILTTPDNVSQIFQAPLLETLGDFFLSVEEFNMTFANDASISVPNIQALNGYIQVPNRVIMVSQMQLSLNDNVNALTLGYSSDISYFRQLVQASRLERLLQQVSENGLTLFVPNNNAFELLGANSSVLNETTDQTILQNFIEYHIFDSNLFSGVGEYALYMHNDATAWITSDALGNQLYINSVNAAELYLASNGYVSVSWSMSDHRDSPTARVLLLTCLICFPYSQGHLHHRSSSGASHHWTIVANHFQRDH
jgi:uncharacterized surface protein with fasciclin (FAS1) repeats